MKRELQRIANTLVLYSYHIENPGLLEGKIGVIGFLYQYAEKVNNTYYSDFAGDLLDKVLSSVGRMATDFEHGLSGIGWTVNELMKNRLVDGEPNDVLQDVDKRVFKQLKCDPFVSLFGQGIYLLERIKSNQGDPAFKEYITNALNFCYKGLTEYKGPKSLYHINSVLFFLIEVDKIGGYAKSLSAIRKLLPGIIEEVIKQKRLDEVDLFLFDKLLVGIKSKQKNRWKEILLLKPEKVESEFTLESTMKIAWLEKVYFGKSRITKPAVEEIREFIDKKQESLCLDDFLFSNGLTGLGSLLLS